MLRHENINPIIVIYHFRWKHNCLTQTQDAEVNNLGQFQNTCVFQSQKRKVKDTLIGIYNIQDM